MTDYSEALNKPTGINLYLMSELDYKRGLASRLVEGGVVDFCLVNSLPWTARYDECINVKTVDHGPFLFDEYDRVCNINDIPCVSKSLIEKMLPYESTAIKMGCRRLNVPVSEYEEEKRKYLQHLRYGNYLLDKYRINLIVLPGHPHSPGSYVIYGLAQVKGIQVMLWSQQDTFLNRVLWGDSIENIGMNIARRYNELCKQGIVDFELDPDVVAGYEKVCQHPDNLKVSLVNKRKMRSADELREKQLKDKKREYDRDYIRTLARSILKAKSLKPLEMKGISFRTRKRSFAAYSYYKRHLEMSVDRYDRKLAVKADMTCRYILFLLQFSPEASTLPQAGVFAEQYNSIQLLSRAAQKVGVKVYVKEHPHNPGRSKDFYDEIRFIDNVRLIRSYESTYELMKNSIAVSTQTGSCIWEAVGMKKPIFVFSSGYFWKGCPGVYEMVDEKQGADLIKRAIDGIEMRDEDIRRYLYAIGLETIKEVTPWEMNDYAMNPTKEAPHVDLEERVQLIKRFIDDRLGVCGKN